MHNIFGERFIGRRKPGWHLIGTVFPQEQKMTATQAAEAAGLMYDIVKVPALAQVNGVLGSEMVTLDGHYALVRMPTMDDPIARPLGMCGNSYDFLQNIEMARLLDPISELYPVETIGDLGYGETVFYTFDAGEARIAWEDYHLYFLYTDTRNGRVKAKMAFTPVRVVCQNTLRLGLRQAIVAVALAHNADHRDMVTWQLKMVEGMAKAKKLSIQALERFAKLSLVAEQVQQVLAMTYPSPKRPEKAYMLEDLKSAADDGIEAAVSLYNEAGRAQETFEYYVNRAQTFRDAAYELFYKFGDENKRLANTGYALYQAVVESADFRNGAESAPASSLFGVRALEKVRAWNAIETVSK
jgi:hypothetical protein